MTEMMFNTYLNINKDQDLAVTVNLLINSYRAKHFTFNTLQLFVARYLKINKVID